MSRYFVLAIIAAALTGCTLRVCPDCPKCEPPPAPKFGASYSPDGCNTCTPDGWCTAMSCESFDDVTFQTVPAPYNPVELEP